MEPDVNVTELIDSQGLNRAQIAIVVLCGLIAVFDGLDLQAIGLAAPAMAADLHIAPRALGPVLSAALAGLAVGAFSLGLAADRVGRKRVLIGSTLCFGAFTLCTAFASSMNELLIIRFCTGLGLGGAMPSFISLGAEYVPRRFRATVVSGLWAGFPIGGVIGGLLASRLIPHWGWPSIFWVGGALPLLLAAVLGFVLPESIGFLVSRNASPQRIARLLARVCPGAHPRPDARFVLGEERAPGVPVRHLFRAGRGVGTVLLWVSFFIAFMMLVTNSAWSPTLLRAEGIEVAQSAIAMATFNFGSVIGTSLAGWLISRLGVVGVPDRIGGAVLPDGDPLHGGRLVDGNGADRFLCRPARGRRLGRCGPADRLRLCRRRGPGIGCSAHHRALWLALRPRPGEGSAGGGGRDAQPERGPLATAHGPTPPAEDVHLPRPYPRKRGVCERVSPLKGVSSHRKPVSRQSPHFGGCGGVPARSDRRIILPARLVEPNLDPQANTSSLRPALGGRAPNARAKVWGRRALRSPPRVRAPPRYRLRRIC
jgi:MFS transporter, AAHS family, 4-hydroxybenzoate transporter